ncbi:MAG: Spy/CpxP family protein refolding chaperone [Acidobacteria bacterium]|nr:Spy/CpxP family protein refolding chaperone [Acidobacteriota bacterium]
MFNRSMIATFTLLLAALPAAAQPAPGGPPPMGGPGLRAAQARENLEFLAHHLKLSEAQRTQIKDIHARHRESLQAKRKAAQEARQALHKAAMDPAAPLETLRRLHQSAADRQFEVLAEQRAVRLEARGVFTPEQRAEADRLQALGEERRQFRMERLRGAMERRMGRGMGPGMGPGRGPGGPGGPFAD